jgi:hypothetical protein
MRIRLSLGWLPLLALWTLILGSPVQAQVGAPDPAPLPDGHSLQIASPRAAVLGLYEGAAESFLLQSANREASPIALEPSASGKIRLHAEYESLFLPLTAGWTRYRFAASRLGDAGSDLLAEDAAEVIDFGPSRHRGRLMLEFALRPGLHHLEISLRSAVRPVGTPNWTVDEDAVQLWVLVPGAAAAAGPNPLLPLGGLAAGSQRAVSAEDVGGALNFEAAPGSQLVARLGQPVPVWTDYELWWTESAQGSAQVSLTIYRQRIDGSRDDSSAIAGDRKALNAAHGPRLEDGTLEAKILLDAPGSYALVALLETQVQVDDMVFVDQDRVPFTLKVLGDPPNTGQIAGRVIGRDGFALEAVPVLAHAEDGRVVGRAQSNADGKYRIDGLTPGKLRVQAAPQDHNYLEQWYQGQPTARTADPVEVVRGRTSEGIDFELIPGGSILGRVTDAAGQPLADIEITAGRMASAGQVAEPVDPVPGDPALVGGNAMPRSRSNADGWYRLQQLPAGRYWVRARDPQGRYLEEYFADQPSLREADPVAVAAGEQVEDIDFELAPGGSIAGQVRQESQLTVIIPLPGMRVEALDPEDPTRVLAVTESGRDGQYKLAALREGRYLVRASDPSGRHLSEWFREAVSPADAQVVAVRAGQSQEPVDFTLAPTPARTRVFVDPTLSAVNRGGSGRLALAAADVENLAAFEVALKWDPNILRVDGVELGDFLASTGREVIPVEPEIDNERGQLRFAAASLGRQPGASGEGILFHLTFTGIALGETELSIVESLLTQPSAQLIAHAALSGKIKVGACIRGDFDCNCRVDIRDVMAVVSRWGTRAGDPDYDPRFDLDADGDIDIIDVQIVASLWGKSCTADPTDPTALDDSAVQPSPLGLLSPSIALQSSQSGVAPGEILELDIHIDEAVELTGFELALAFDDSMLRFEDAELGEFLSSTGRSLVPLGPIAEGSGLRIGAAALPGKPAPSGSGSLARLRFRVLAAGSSSVQFSEAMTVDADLVSSFVPATGYSVEVGKPGGRAIIPIVMQRR